MVEPLDLFNIFPGMCSPETEHLVTKMLLAEQITARQIKRTSLDIISTVCARPWWFSMRLIKTAVASWEVVGGELAVRGVDAEKLSVSAWLDAVLYLCLRTLDGAKMTSFMTQLEAPPPEEVVESPVLMEMTTDEFLALASR